MEKQDKISLDIHRIVFKIHQGFENGNNVCLYFHSREVRSDPSWRHMLKQDENRPTKT